MKKQELRTSLDSIDFPTTQKFPERVRISLDDRITSEDFQGIDNLPTKFPVQSPDNGFDFRKFRHAAKFFPWSFRPPGAIGG